MDAYKQGMKQNGEIYIHSKSESSIRVYCDMLIDGGGWIVLQRRNDNSTSFYRGWEEYKLGFGSLDGNFWLGLKAMHQLTSRKKAVLRIDLVDKDGKTGFAKYTDFKIHGPKTQYRLQVGTFSGNVGDSLFYHNGMEFSTADMDNDAHSSYNMAVTRGGPWWFGLEYKSNLNNFAYENHTLSYRSMKKMSWFSWSSSYGSIKFSEMKMRTEN